MSRTTFRVRFAGLCPTNFVSRRGFVLELSPADDAAQSLRAFNCAFVSSSPGDDQRLFFGGAHSLKMASIRALATAQNYALFLGALRIIDDVFSAETPSAIDAGDAQ